MNPRSQVQNNLKLRGRASLNKLLTVPLLRTQLSAEEIQAELDNNCQVIAEHVWIETDMDTGYLRIRSPLGRPRNRMLQRA